MLNVSLDKNCVREKQKQQISKVSKKAFSKAATFLYVYGLILDENSYYHPRFDVHNDKWCKMAHRV